VKAALPVLRGIGLWLAFAVLKFIVLIATPILMIVFVWFAKQTTRASKLADMPSWLAWFDTPDDPTGDQGDYEPQVMSIWKALGWRFKTWYWLGVRNQMYGLTYAISAQAPAGMKPRLSTAAYPKTKNVYTPGVCVARLDLRGVSYFEINAVWPYSATKCGQFRAGWMLAEMDFPGPVVWAFQPKFLPLTINSTT